MADEQFMDVLEIARLLGDRALELDFIAEGLVFVMRVGGKHRGCRINLSIEGLPSLVVLLGEIPEGYTSLIVRLNAKSGYGAGTFEIVEGVLVWGCVAVPDDPDEVDDVFDLRMTVERLIHLAHVELYASYALVELARSGAPLEMLNEQFEFCTRMPLEGRH